MSGDVDLSKLRKWIGKAKQIGEPPGPGEGRAAASERGKYEQLVQLNIKVAASTKRRLKQLAVRDDVKLGVLLTRMLDLYEKEHSGASERGGQRS
jgi:hypothetical protein